MGLLALTGLYVLVFQAWAQLEVSMEDRVEVLLGNVAEIPCIYSMSQLNGSLLVQWFARSPSGNEVKIYYKDKVVEVVSMGTDYSERINVSHAVDGTVGSSILTINDVRVKDEQEFVCQVQRNTSHTKLLVFSTPSVPHIELGSYTPTVNLKREEIASCEVNNAYPAPNITWYKNRLLLQSSVNNMELEKTVTQNPSGLFIARSTLFLQVEKADEDAEFYCEVSYFTIGGLHMMESQIFHVELHYSTTKVTISVDSPHRLVKEGDRVKIRCKGNGNPQPIFSFQHNSRSLNVELDHVVLDNVTRAHSGLYKCTSLDQVDFSELTDSLELMVHYLDPVVITSGGSSDMLDLGQHVSLTCNALSSLPTNTTWYKDGTVLEEGHILNLLNLSYDMAGTYVCEVHAPSLAELKRQNSLNITVRGKPVMVEEVAMISLDAEDSVNLTCSVKGHPIPDIQWNLSDNQTILGERITMTDYTIVSVITIRATSLVNASCVATNELGSAQAFSDIKPIQKPTATTAIIITSTRSTKEGNGVVIAVIIILILLLAILGSVLYFLYKKGKIPCGRSGKQDLMKEKSSKDDVEMKNSRSEEAVLLQGVNGGKRSPSDQDRQASSTLTVPP
ncbi:melanoma cell adhesion molecule b isoform X2 [Electrophorus electricus]|uniref:melanoma cell adhesion molecule b isoform X2 n=1 Tax=Electrophorus electricus TaxID=8005 RepID=UPI0015CFF149|nr:melanoma cell adhesion molecule b isoform X2 [Electrophorus electricus]